MANHDEFDEVINLAIESAKASGGDFVPSVIAGKLVAAVEESQPEMLDEWLHHRVVAFVTTEIAQRLRFERNRAVRRFQARSFAEASEDAANGDIEPLTQFAITYEVDEKHTRRQVADMTGDDHRFVATKYRASGKYDLMLAAFHGQVAKVVGPRRTADVMTEEQYADLLHSVAKKSA